MGDREGKDNATEGEISVLNFLYYVKIEDKLNHRKILLKREKNKRRKI